MSIDKTLHLIFKVFLNLLEIFLIFHFFYGIFGEYVIDE